MGGRSKMVENLDRKALREYIVSKKLGITSFAKSLGLAQNYFSEVLRDKNPKNMTVANYKYICAVLKVPEDKFIIKEPPKPVVKKTAEKPAQQPLQVVNNGLTPEQFNALLQAISGLGDTISKALDKISTAQNSGAVIQGKIYGEVVQMADALGVHQTPTLPAQKTTIAVKPQYAHLGEKKNG